MKTLSPLFTLLPLIHIFGFHSSLVLAQINDTCLPRAVVYGVFNDWLQGFISNYSYFSSLPGWTDDTLDPALVVTEEQVNYLDGPSSGLPAHGPYATSKKDFLQKVGKGLQFPYRDYVGEIQYSSDNIFTDDASCARLAYGFTATAQTIKKSSVPVGTTVTWKGAFFVTLSYTNETHRILSVNTSQDWLSYLSGAGIKIRPEG